MLNNETIKIVKDIILNQITRGETQKIVEGDTTLPKLSSVNQFFDVSVEELYDDTDYFNEEPDVKKELNNIYPIDINLYSDLSKAIVNAINQYPFY